jgi:ATP-dependent Lon protease
MKTLYNLNKTKVNIQEKNIYDLEIHDAIKSKIEYIQEIIRNTLLSLHNNKKNEIFSNSEINICINSLQELYKNTQKAIEKNRVNLNLNIKNVDTVVETLQTIIEKLSLIISGFGTQNIEDLLFICFGSDYKGIKFTDKIVEKKYELIKSYSHPISYKIINWKTQKHNNNNNKDYVLNNYCENKITEDNIIIENANNIECFDIDNTAKSFYSKINGIRVVFQNEKIKKTLIVYCIVDDIILDFFSNEYIEFRKKNIYEKIPNSETFDKTIIERITNSLTLKDILVCGNNDIYKKQLTIQSDVNSIKYNKLENTIKKFLEMELILQRNMLINLLIYNKDDDINYITYLLYDLITVRNNEMLDSNEQKIIYDSFPFKIKTYFQETMKMTVKYTQDMISKYDISKITLEQQIYLLKAPDSIKEKAMVKFKEIKGKTDDSSNKAKQYLEGLLKIPFGIFKQEPLLKKIKEINKIYKNIENTCKELNLDKKENYTNIEILGNIEKIKGFVQNSFIYSMKEKIESANMKQLNAMIHFIQSIQLIQTVNPVLKNKIQNETLRELKTKPQKKNALLDLLELFSNDQSIMQIYKWMDIFQNNQQSISFSKIPNEIVELEYNIKDVQNSLEKITHALDESIYGHTHAKKQILKIIAQWMTGEQTGYCFGFEGCPGIGKTSLAKKGLSNCLKDENGVSRPFSFIALGGSCNGSTLEGHSYTYVNSTWGKIVDILMETKCMNPIIYIDELDKVSKTEHGKEITGILTHLIDSTQNDVFQDKYFSGIDIDLSKALFIFSYNDPEQIDRILLDRIHRIKFENLTLDDKIVIVEKYILPDINKRMGFSDIVIMEREVIEYIIEQYTYEPGVRKLKEILFDLYGEINIEILTASTPQKNSGCESEIEIDSENNESNIIKIPITISKRDLDTKYLLKYSKIEEKKIHKEPKIGIINGLWANSLGKGGIIPIEVVYFPCSSFLDLKLTGMQGDVMKESMNVAKSLAWMITKDEKKKDLLKYFENSKCQGVHIHCPEGAINKDGPSAGVAITVAIYSLLNKLKIKNDIAITGEINLQGEITAIGGLETKIIGGIRAGIKTFIFPEANKRDFEEVKKKIGSNRNLDNVQFIQVSSILQVINILF